MSHKGYIKLHRKLSDDVVFASPELLKVWVWCLIKASYKECKVPMVSGSAVYEVKLLPGQFVTGSRKAAKELKMTVSSFHRRTAKLVSLNKITQKAEQHYRVITVINWERYQSLDIEGETAPEQHRNSTGTAPEPFKKFKEGEEYKETLYAPSVVETTERSLFAGLDFAEKHGRRKRYLGTKNYDCGVIYDQRERRLIFDGDTSWIDTYNAAGNPRAEVQEAEQWLAVNTPGKGTKEHYRRFLVGWLKRWQEREITKSQYTAQKYGGKPITTTDNASKAWSELQNHVKTAPAGALPRDKATCEALDVLGGYTAFFKMTKEARVKLMEDFKKAYRKVENS